jgi:hypothetical protein
MCGPEPMAVSGSSRAIATPFLCASLMEFYFGATGLRVASVRDFCSGDYTGPDSCPIFAPSMLRWARNPCNLTSHLSEIGNSGVAGERPKNLWVAGPARECVPSPAVPSNPNSRLGRDRTPMAHWRTGSRTKLSPVVCRSFGDVDFPCIEVQPTSCLD